MRRTGRSRETAAPILGSESFNNGEVVAKSFYILGTYTGGPVGSAEAPASFTVSFTQDGGPGTALSASGTLTIPPTAVPQQASVLMLGMGMVGVGGFAYLRRKAKYKLIGRGSLRHSPEPCRGQGPLLDRHQNPRLSKFLELHAGLEAAPNLSHRCGGKFRPLHCRGDPGHLGRHSCERSIRDPPIPQIATGQQTCGRRKKCIEIDPRAVNTRDATGKWGPPLAPSGLISLESWFSEESIDRCASNVNRSNSIKFLTHIVGDENVFLEVMDHEIRSRRSASSSIAGASIGKGC